MNGWIIARPRKKRQDGWAIILDYGPKPGGGRRQKWTTFHGTRKEAEQRLRSLLTDADRGELVEPSRRTLASWLNEWLEKSVKPRWAASTHVIYKRVVKDIEGHNIGAMRLQQLRTLDIEAYLAALDFSTATRRIHRNAISSALRLAVRDGLVHRNVANGAVVPREEASLEPPSLPAWTAEEAKRVLEAAAARDTQTSALIALALDSGARRGEFRGLRWSELDLSAGTMRIERQLLRLEKGVPIFGPTKTRRTRTVDLCGETVRRLREHRRIQAELKLANRPEYTDHGLVFARAPDQGVRFGLPLTEAAIRAMLDRLTKDANVRRIAVHGLRHTSATLLLAAGVQPHVVQARLGHGSIRTTLDFYSHVLPSMQQDAANRLGEMLYGRNA